MLRRGECRAAVNTVINFRVAQIAGKFLLSEELTASQEGVWFMTSITVKCEDIILIIYSSIRSSIFLDYPLKVNS